jgi:subtilisin
VAATSLKDTPSDFTSTGPELDLAAPGEDIVAVGPDGRYRSYRGTSYAATIAASVGALVLSVRPDPSADDVEAILRQSAKKLDWGGGKVEAGRVDALAAVQLAKTYKSSKN